MKTTNGIAMGSGGDISSVTMTVFDIKLQGEDGRPWALDIELTVLGGYLLWI